MRRNSSLNVDTIYRKLACVIEEKHRQNPACANEEKHRQNSTCVNEDKEKHRQNLACANERSIDKGDVTPFYDLHLHLSLFSIREPF